MSAAAAAWEVSSGQRPLGAAVGGGARPRLHGGRRGARSRRGVGFAHRSVRQPLLGLDVDELLPAVGRRWRRRWGGGGGGGGGGGRGAQKERLRARRRRSRRWRGRWPEEARRGGEGGGGDRGGEGGGGEGEGRGQGRRGREAGGEARAWMATKYASAGPAHSAHAFASSAERGLPLMFHVSKPKSSARRRDASNIRVAGDDGASFMTCRPLDLRVASDRRSARAPQDTRASGPAVG